MHPFFRKATNLSLVLVEAFRVNFPYDHGGEVRHNPLTAGWQESSRK